jgi:dienelactone hydrolase
MEAIPTAFVHRGLAIAALRGAPPGGRGPGILLVHDAWGLDEDAAALVAALAGAGCVVLAPDLFGGRRAADSDEARALATGLDPEDASLVLAAAVDAITADLGTRPGPLGAVGIGMGAPLVAFVATLRPEIAFAVLAGPVPDLPLEAWARAEADLVVLAVPGAGDAAADDRDGIGIGDRGDVAGGPEDGEADEEPDIALDRARAGGRRADVVEPVGGDLAGAVVRVVVERVGA